MAVYTEVAPELAQGLCAALGLGDCVRLDPIVGGIENTNYFLHTQRTDEPVQKRVLTLFERLNETQLPYYLELMRHLALQGLNVPEPIAAGNGGLVHRLAGKPASVVSCLAGKSELSPSAAHCAQMGATLARMHLAAASFSRSQPNLRGLAWWADTAPKLLPHLSEDQARMLQHELALQQHVHSSCTYAALPRGPVHADAFRDNVMFTQDAHGQPQLSGVFDFYFAGNDTWLFDLAVCLNDWAIEHASGAWREDCRRALLDAYQAVRPLQAAERALFGSMLRAAALRFWISRLWDWHLPREASLLKPHDPTHFERVLRLRSTQFVTL